MEIISAWKTLLDKASIGGKRQVVSCSDVQHEVFDVAGPIEVSETDSESGDQVPITKAEQSQRIGMKKAKDREDTRRAARLIYHFGFQHFAPKPPVDGFVDDQTGSKKKGGKPAEIGGTPADRQLEAMQNGKVIHDVTHAKGEWGLRYKRD